MRVDQRRVPKLSGTPDIPYQCNSPYPLSQTGAEIVRVVCRCNCFEAKVKWNIRATQVWLLRRQCWQMMPDARELTWFRSVSCLEMAAAGYVFSAMDNYNLQTRNNYNLLTWKVLVPVGAEQRRQSVKFVVWQWRIHH